MTREPLRAESAPETPRAVSPGIAVLMLALCCVFWGFSFPAAQLAMHAMKTHALAASPHAADDVWLGLGLAASFTGWRFTLGLAFLAILLRRNAKPVLLTDQNLRGPLLIASMFALALTAQMFGLRFTRPSTSGFLTALSVVFAPLVQELVFRVRLGWGVWISVALALAGTWAMTQQGSESALQATGPFPYFGEIVTAGSALLFTAQILALDHYGKTISPRRITFAIFICTAAFGLVLGASLAGGPLYAAGAWRAILSDPLFLWCFCGTVALSALAQHWMNVYQPRLVAATATVIYCLEPIFATLFSVALGSEALTAATITGGVLILIAALLVARTELRRSRT